MYDDHEVLRQMESHAELFLVLVSLAAASSVVWYVANLYTAWRTRRHPVPLGMCYFWVAHDMSISLGLGLDQSVADHPYIVALRWGMAPLAVCNLVYLYSIMRFGRSELAPHLNRNLYITVLAVGAAITTLNWIVLKNALGDGLYLVTLALSASAAPPWTAALLWRRRSRAGISRIAWDAFAVIIPGIFGCTLVLGGPFVEWPWITLGVLATLGGIGAAVMIHRAPAHPLGTPGDGNAPPARPARC